MQEPRSLPQFFSPLMQICGALLITAFACFSVCGQTVNGRINGPVSDSSGAVVPNAAVTITNTSTNATRTAVTDDSGFYTVTNLPVGTYTVTVERNGFKKANQTGNVLTADQRLTVNITLEEGNTPQP